MIKIIITLATLGLFDSLYLSYSRLTQNALMCDVVKGCNVVASSPQSTLLGVPLAYLGVVYYVSMILLGVLYMQGNMLAGKLMLPIATIGVLFSAYFVYLQFFVIEAVCTYCMTSALISCVMLILAYKLYMTI